MRLFSDPATSSKIPALERASFRELASYARPGDQLTVSELYRLCRDLADILAVRERCQRHEVKLRVLSGALSGIVDLVATDVTITMLVNALVSVGRFQRDLQTNSPATARPSPGQAARSPAAAPAWPNSPPPRRFGSPSVTAPASPPWPASMESAGLPSAPLWPICCPTNPAGPPSSP
ncbi:Resolvase, N terminal domain [Actinokineospora iranica]|uniref:Resolvase, N terminal domain n=1 Tax=Actinokineospora iranica TaxID=1271860 RepID=A0A1G6WT16_9PSEU|nr:Resolvase, N terminal domain [Actinokineospora iranica]